MAKITVTSNGETRIIRARPGSVLSEALATAGFHVPAPCGGRGKCGKCGVRLLFGGFSGVRADAEGKILSCRARVDGDSGIEVYETEGEGLTGSIGTALPADGEPGYGVALDVGTTTLAAYLVELATGRELDAQSCLNPQGALGADVISRIARCGEGGLGGLQSMVIGAANRFVEGFCARHGIQGISRMTVAGNTAMLHIFAGVDPTPLGTAPFTPAFTGQRSFSGSELGLNVDTAILLPSSSAYIGSDVTCGVLATGLLEAERPALLIDVGTNGEMVLCRAGKLVSCSTAAGPAFEGATISCGMGGVAGAVDSVREQDRELVFTTVSGPAAGICGAGLVDAVAVLLDGGAIDETGAFADPADVKSPALAKRLSSEGFTLCRGVTLTQKDVREVQLAKSAIYSGIQTLAESQGLTLAEIDKVYLAGGFGFYLDKANAARIGLLPREFLGRIEEVGNSAGRGAKLCLVSKEARKKCGEIAERIRNIELADQPAFMDRYIENMYFQESR